MLVRIGLGHTRRPHAFTLSTHLVPPDAHDPAAEPAGALSHADADITVRSLVSLADLRACVALQEDVWGKEYGDAVPASLLQVVTHIGGILAGAFSPDGELVGFVFGFTGIKHGEVVHWSHQLGVRSSARNAGVGRMLKQYQRAELARQGVATVFWTFDPLMAKNAHLNLNRLGAQVVEYVENMYGITGSPLHLGLATDRLIVSWPTTESPSPRARTIVDGHDRYPILSAEPQPGDRLGCVADVTDGERAPLLLLEVPTDVQRIPPTQAAAWQTSLRTHFEAALRAGYVVTGLYRDAVGSRSFYVLELTAERAA
jgi:predicted GNAT superfamily acetyltransferase